MSRSAHDVRPRLRQQARGRSGTSFEPYFTDAILETATDPNLVHDVATKLDQAGIYTQAEVDQCAEAVGQAARATTPSRRRSAPAKKRFARRYTAALIDNGGRATRPRSTSSTLFRKDVGTFVRLYDFMSQIIDYGDPDLEKRSIFLRLLERVIQPNNYTAPHRPVRRGAGRRSSRSTRASQTSDSASPSA